MAIADSHDEKKFGAYFWWAIIDWIRNNIEPDKVYPEEQLRAFITDKYDPEDIFEWDVLAAWAEHNDFVYSE